MSIFSDQQMLQEIGLSEVEGKVYAALATNYFRTLEEVRAYSDLSREEASSALENLKEKKFVRKIDGKVNLYIAMNPHLAVTSEAEKRLEKDLNQVSDSVKEIWEQTSKKLQEEIVSYMGAVHESSANHSKKLNSQTMNILEESEEAIGTVEQDMHKIVADFTTDAENILMGRIENATGQFEKEGAGFLKLVESQTGVLKNNLSGLESELSEIAKSSIRNKPTKAIVGYREEIQNQAISRIQESIDQLGIVQEQVRKLLTATSEQVGQGNDGLERAIQGMSGKAVEDFGENIDHLDQTLVKIESKTTTLASEVLAIMKESLGPLRENLRIILADNSALTESVASQSSSSLVSSFDEVKNRVNNGVASSEKSIKKTFSNMEISVQESSSELLVQMNKTLQASKDQLLEVKENAVKSLETQFLELEEERSSRTSKALINMETVKEALNQSMGKLQKLIIEGMENVSLTATESLEESASSISERIDHFRSLVREQLESLEAAGEMVVGQLQGKFGATIDSFSQHTSEKTKRSIETLVAEEIPKDKESMKARLEEACSNAEAIVSELSQLQEMFEGTYQSEIVLKKPLLHNTIVSKIDATRDEMISSLEKTKTSINEEYTRLREKVPQGVELMVEEQRNRVLHVNMDIRAALRELLTPLGDLIRGGPDAAKKQIKKKKQFQEFYDTLKKGVDNAQQIEDKIEATLNQNVDEFSTEVNDFLNFFSKTVQDSGQEIERFVEESAEKTKEETTTLKGIIYAEIDSFIEASGTKIAENSSNSLHETEKIVKAVVSNLSSVSETIVETSDRFSSKLTNISEFTSQLAEQAKKGVNTQLDEFAITMRGAIRAIIDQSVEQIDAAIQKLVTKAESAGIGQKEKMAETATAAVKEANQTFQGATESTNEAFEKTKGLVTTLQEQANTSMKAAQSEIAASLEAILVSQEENKLESALQTLLKLHDDVEGRIEVLRSNIADTHLKQQKELLKTVGELNKTVEGIFGQNKEKIVTVTEGLANQIIDAQTAASSEIDREFNRGEESLAEAGNRQTQISNEFESMKSLLTEKREKAIKDLEDSVKQSQEAQKSELSLQLNAILKILTSTLDEIQNTFSDEAAKLTKLRSDLHKDIEKLTDSVKRELERLSEDLGTKAKQINLSFSSKFDTSSLDLKGKTDSFISENRKSIHDEISSTISTLRTQAEDLEKKALTPVKANYDKLSNLAGNASEEIPASLDALITDLDTKITALVEMLTKKIGHDIDGIPETIRSGLEKTGSVMKFIRAVHDLAVTAPPNPIEHTYFVIGKEGVQGAMKGALERTKSAMNIIIPMLSTLPVETIKTLPKTRRIQILAGIDDMSIVKELADQNNVQLREMIGEEGTIGFFRDGEEEGAIGAGTGELGQMIVTTDAPLVKTMNQLFADLWPRGKKI